MGRGTRWVEPNYGPKIPEPSVYAVFRARPRKQRARKAAPRAGLRGVACKRPVHAVSQTLKMKNPGNKRDPGDKISQTQCLSMFHGIKPVKASNCKGFQQLAQKGNNTKC